MGSAEQKTPWTEFQAELHTVLHLPRACGGFIVGLTGVALLSSLLSGVLSHPRVFKDAFAFRWGGSKRLQEADLHNRISVWGLATLAACASAIVGTPAGISIALRRIAAGLLALVAVAHAGFNFGAMVDAVGWIIDASLLATAALLAATTLKPKSAA